jgi:DNA-3-methyladenine glycosylase
MALNIDKTFNELDLTESKAFYLEDPQLDFTVEESKRINIKYAEEWVDKPWRFTMKGNVFVSKGK